MKLNLSSFPKPLLNKLTTMLLIGAACFAIGAVYSLVASDKMTLALSSAVLIACAIRTVGLYFTVSKLKYIVINGVCLTNTQNILRGTRTIKIIDTSGITRKLLLPKNARVIIGESYRIYFSGASDEITDGSLNGRFLAIEDTAESSVKTDQ